jgi:hypothetical protein
MEHHLVTVVQVNRTGPESKDPKPGAEGATEEGVRREEESPELELGSGWLATPTPVSAMLLEGADQFPGLASTL